MQDVPTFIKITPKNAKKQEAHPNRFHGKDVLPLLIIYENQDFPLALQSLFHGHGHGNGSSRISTCSFPIDTGFHISSLRRFTHS